MPYCGLKLHVKNHCTWQNLIRIYTTLYAVKVLESGKNLIRNSYYANTKIHLDPAKLPFKPR